jgi:hypothetical protein
MEKIQTSTRHTWFNNALTFSLSLVGALSCIQIGSLSPCELPEHEKQVSNISAQPREDAIMVRNAERRGTLMHMEGFDTRARMACPKLTSMRPAAGNTSTCIQYTAAACILLGSPACTAFSSFQSPSNASLRPLHSSTLFLSVDHDY